MPSFDVVSEINIQEVDNAINQAQKEIASRYDFKGSQSEIKWDRKEIILLGDDDYKMSAMKDIVQTKAHRRGIDIKSLQFADIEPAGGKMLRQKITLRQGIDKEVGKKICQLVKDAKLKVQAQIADEKVRVTSKSIDELQETMALLRGASLEIPIQFNNMRS